MTGLSTKDTERLTRVLQELPALMAELDAIGETPAISQESESRRPVPGSRSPVNLTRLTLLSGSESALAILTAWTRAIATDARANDVDLPDMTEHATAASECTWLLAVRWHLVHWPQAASMVADLATLHGRIRSHLGYREQRWPCPEPGCQDQAEITPDRRHLLCPNDHLTDGPLILITKWLRHPGMTEKHICEAFGIPRGTFSAWATRKKIRRITADGVRPVLYLPWDALVLHRPQLVRVAQDLEQEAS